MLVELFYHPKDVDFCVIYKFKENENYQLALSPSLSLPDEEDHQRISYDLLPLTYA